MKKLLKALCTLGTLCFFSLPSAAEEVKILYISSLPEIIKNRHDFSLAQIATAVRSERDKSDDIIFVHGGASLGPSTLGAMDNGAHMIDILNILEPDVMGVGKREFSYKEDQFSLHAQSAMFPFISSNIQLREGHTPIVGLEPYYVIDTVAHSIGFMGVTSENVIDEYGSYKLEALPLDNSIRKTAEVLRSEGAEYIVLMADTDYDDLSVYTADGTVDLILYAHNVDNPYSVDTGTEKISKGMLDGQLIAIDIEFGTAESPKAEITLSDIRSYEEDPEIKSIVESYDARLDVLFKQVLGKTDTAINTDRNTVRTGENAFGNFVADSIRNAMKADIAFINSGGIRGNTQYPAGTVLTREHIQSELPFNNTVQLFEITGAQIQGALEHGLSCLDDTDGCFLQVSNIQMDYNSKAPVGERVVSVTIGGVPLVPSQTYTAATLNFLASGGDGFKMLQNMPQKSNLISGKLLWEVVASQLAEQQTIAPKIENRLIDQATESSAS